MLYNTKAAKKFIISGIVNLYVQKPKISFFKNFFGVNLNSFPIFIKLRCP